MRARFGRALRLLRHARGYSQEDLGAVATRRTVGLLENGQRHPSFKTIESLSDVLGVLPATLVAASYPDQARDRDAFFERLGRELDEIEAQAEQEEKATNN